jgi:3-hydroxyanthranilate 3,4-dioxygenase
MDLAPPIDFQRWIDEHRDLLKPPVANKCIYDGDFIVMIVGGPNQRTDYHYEEGPEFFHQLEGEVVLRLMLEDGPKDVPIRAGEVFYLPPRIPHSPQRMAGSVGLVIERRRLAHEQDGLMWYCPNCHAKVYEEYFPLRDIENDFPAVFERFYRSRERRTCRNCDTVHPAPERYAN